MLFDSHTHLNNESFSDEKVKELASKIEASDVGYIMNVGFDLASSKLAVEQAARYSWCYAAVGCHPHDADGMDEIELMMYKSLAQKDKVKAIGEIGLDYHYDNSDRDNQREWFRRQIQLANELKMPISIHSRDADQECMDILKQEKAFSDERKSWFPKREDGTGDARVVLHCFSGSAELAQQYVKLGATISIAGPLTFKNNRKTQKVVRAIPLGNLLIETDAPYLTPEPNRGKENDSTNVIYVAKKIAEIKEIPFEDVAEATLLNAKRFFSII